MEEIARNKSFGGTQVRCKHFSTTTICEMTFSVFLPEQLSTEEDLEFAKKLSIKIKNEQK